MKKELDDILRALKNLTRFSLLLGLLLAFVLLLRFEVIHFPATSNKRVQEIPEKAEEELPANIGSVDAESGLIIDEGFVVVKSQCGACHSTQLVAQNRFSRENWLELIRWMQKEQNLWDLGPHEEVILDYLEKNYAPQKSGRRKNLENIEWYEL